MEDDDNLRITLVDKLSRLCQTDQAGDGEEAVTKFVDNKPNLIILDLMLPKVDGFKVLERLRHYPDKEIADIPVVVLSNLWSNKDILQVKALKIEDYFVKANTNLEDVIKRVQQILASADIMPSKF